MRETDSPNAPRQLLLRLGRPLLSLRAFGVILALMTAVFVMQHGLRLMVEPDPVAGLQPWGGVSIRKLSEGHVWTLFTHLLVHGGLLHFAVNLLFYWFAGRGVQDLVGSRHFVKVFVLSGFVGAAAQMVVNAFGFADKVTPLVGASAAIFGLLMTYAVLLPDEPIDVMLYFIIPIPLRLWTAAKWLIIVHLILGVYGVIFHRTLVPGLSVAWFAHLGGAVAGWLYARALGYGGRPMTYASQWQPDNLRERSPEMVAASRARVEVDLEAAAPAVASTSRLTLEQQVDAVLDKMNELGGIEHLTPEERALLERAAQK